MICVGHLQRPIVIYSRRILCITMASVLRRKAADGDKSVLGMILKDRKFARSIVVLVFKATRLRLSRTSHKPDSVVLISAKICIKSNSFTRLAEAEAMVFVSRSTSIPVPRVYSAFEYKQRVYTVMERIHGQPPRRTRYNEVQRQRPRFSSNSASLPTKCAT